MVSTFSNNPKLALNITEFIAGFNAVELTLYQAFGILLGDKDGKLVEVILSKIDSAAYKQNVVFDTARLQSPDDPLAQSLLDAEPIVKQATKMRNELAHGIFALDEHGNIAMINHVFSFGKKPLQSRIIDRQDIVKLNQKLLDKMLAVNITMGAKGVKLHGGIITAKMRTEHRDEDAA